MRNSTYELLRIVAMLFIVFYHVVTYYLYKIPNPENQAFFTALLPTLHIGVILFVLISGYFGIKSTWKGMISLLIVVIIYNLPFILNGVIRNGEYSYRLMFITNTPYWFIRCYLYLYLVAPFVNKAIDKLALRERVGALVAFGVISIYFGCTEGDITLQDGKNLVNFIFLYLLGNILKVSQDKWQPWNVWLLLGIFIAINVLTFTILYLSYGTYLHDYVFNISFPYRSPLLIINAILVFMMFGKLHINSVWINSIATSMFAVYIIHCQPMIHNIFVMGALRKVLDFSQGGVFVKLLVLTIGIMLICMLIDKCLTPYWKWQNKLLVKYVGDKKLY